MTITPLTAALVAQLVAFSTFAAARGDRRIIAYLVVWSLLALLVRGAHRRWPLPRRTLAALGAAGAVHLAGGLLPSPEDGAPILYETWLVPEVLKFDQLAHFGISAVVTVAVFQLVGQIVDPRAAGPWVRATFAALVCAGFGAANELFEFLSALRFEDSFAGDLTNAGWDLAFNTGGAATAAIACALLASPRVAGSPSRVVSTRRAHCNSEPGSVTVVRTAPGS